MDEQAIDDKCEECWRLWSQNFTFLTWKELLEKNKDKAFQILLRQVRSVMSGSSPPPSKLEEIQASTSYMLELEHTFLAVSEKEFKKVDRALTSSKDGDQKHPAVEGCHAKMALATRTCSSSRTQRLASGRRASKSAWA